MIAMGLLIQSSNATSFGWAWLAATIALALHLADEARHDFLGSYNPRALQIRRWLGGIRFPPTFTFAPPKSRAETQPAVPRLSVLISQDFARTKSDARFGFCPSW